MPPPPPHHRYLSHTATNLRTYASPTVPDYFFFDLGRWFNHITLFKHFFSCSVFFHWVAHVFRMAEM